MSVLWAQLPLAVPPVLCSPAQRRAGCWRKSRSTQPNPPVASSLQLPGECAHRGWAIHHCRAQEFGGGEQQLSPPVTDPILAPHLRGPGDLGQEGAGCRNGIFAQSYSCLVSEHSGHVRPHKHRESSSPGGTPLREQTFGQPQEQNEGAAASSALHTANSDPHQPMS